MRWNPLLALPVLLLMPGAQAQDAAGEAEAEDPYLWLEEIEGEEALAWVRERNAESLAAFDTPEFAALQERLLTVYDSSEKIPSVRRRGDLYYNLWQDADHPRGLWRRTTLDSYRTDEPEWETVLDLDALGAAEEENWVWGGVDCLPPEYERCLVQLSRGGADATVLREFDLATGSFVSKRPFVLPEGKQWAAWLDQNSLLVCTDADGGSQTDSGYPRSVRLWKRGQPLRKAKVIYEGEQTDITVAAERDHTPGFERDVVQRAITFYSNEVFLRTRKGLEKIDKPDSAEMALWRSWLLIELREDWTVGETTWAAGSLLVTNLEAWRAGDRSLEALFEPTETSTLSSWSFTRSHLLLNTLDTVRSRVLVVTRADGAWQVEGLVGAPELGRLYASAENPLESDAYWLTITDFLTPSTLTRGELGAGQPPEVLKQLPSFFDADGLVASQHFATSADGTKIPYFQVAPEGMALDGSNPTLVYGYGGFEVSLLPRYSATRGISWLERGGVYVIANIRGGGEFGPRWHQAALREKRHRAYEDFVAVADDLVARGVTVPARLGAEGGSNGGLLTGNMYTLYPDHFGAIVSEVPLLDMKRYHKLLAGASWVGEYGDPDDPDDWAFIQGFSPYHNLDPADEHPPLMITTSTRDDRVHPGHARKMVAKLRDLGKEVLYFENIEGGHGGAADHKQMAFLYGVTAQFLWERLSFEEPPAEEVEEAP